MEGWLTKKGGRISTWRRRWFVLGGEKLEYFTEQDRKVLKGYLLLRDLTEVGHILHETRNFCIGLRTDKRLYVVSCEDETCFAVWLAKFQEIQPRQLDSEFTNVPHSTLGNIEKQWFSFSKKKSKDKEGGNGATNATPTPTTSNGARSSSGGSQTLPAPSPTQRDSSPGHGDVSSSNSTPRQECGTSAPSSASLSGPSSNSSNNSTNQHSTGAPGSGSTPNDSNQVSPPISASPTPQTSSSLPFTRTTQSSSNDIQGSSPMSFSTMHNSFDLDFGMTINPALTAAPLEDSPFSDTPSATNDLQGTLTIPNMTPIVNTDTAAEESPFE